MTILIATLFPVLFPQLQAQNLASHSFDRLASSNLGLPFQSARCFVYTGYTHHTLLNHAFL